MEFSASRAEPSTTSRTMKPSKVGGGLVLAMWVITAPPREWPIRRIGGREDKESFFAVDSRTKRRSEESVGRVRSSGVVGEEVVRPWARASSDRMPAVGSRGLRALKKVAKERAEEPAPWWVMMRGPFEVGGVR